MIKTENCLFISMIPFLRLKTVRNGYYGNDGVFFAWDLGISFFKRTKLGDWWIFKKTFFANFGLKNVIEKSVGYFLVYLFLGLYFLLKDIAEMKI